METYHEPDQYQPPKTIDEARAAIDAAINDPDFIERALLTKGGPLTRDKFPVEVTHSPGFREADSMFGWPDFEDRGIAAPLDYSDADFLDNLYDNKSFDVNPRSLGNFTARLRAKPITQNEQAHAKLSDLWGLGPEVHRAYAVMSEVMFALHTIYNELAQTMSTPAERIAWLQQPENTDIVTVTNMVYRIMGRLVRATDRIDSEGRPLVTEAHDSLTR